jgi:hypothetical protein
VANIEGVWSNGRGAYIVNSFAFAPADRPADATITLAVTGPWEKYLR